MKSIKEISLFNALEGTTTSSGYRSIPPIIRGFSKLIEPIYIPPAQSSYVSYLTLDGFPPAVADKYRAVLVEGYIRPVNPTAGVNSNRLGFPFAHTAALVPSNTQGGDELIWDAESVEYNSDLYPPSTLTILGVEDCWETSPFTPSTHPVFLSNGIMNFGLSLKYGEGSLGNGQYLVNGIYYMI